LDGAKILGNGSSSKGDKVNPAMLDELLKISSAVELGELSSPQVQIGLSARNEVSIVGCFPPTLRKSAHFHHHSS